MRLFECNNCYNPIYFENTFCENCGMTLGFLPKELQLKALVKISDNKWEVLHKRGISYSFCSNHEYEACNWLVEDHEGPLCLACDLNGTIPNLSKKENLSAWRKLEFAKHRLVYSLLKLNLPVKNKMEDPQTGLQFDFLSPADSEDGKPILTGHANGIITINIDEADSVHREEMRQQLNEKYRTLIGHFRHEISHYYWDILVAPYAQTLALFRAKFGDEQSDYGEALKEYYKKGPDPNWRNEYVSAYATAHPWEDWAETWAHYMHIMDTLETAYSFGLKVKPRIKKYQSADMKANFDPYDQKDFLESIDTFVPLVIAMNSINRSMGQQDLYPFLMPPKVIDKLTFIHWVIQHGKG